MRFSALMSLLLMPLALALAGPVAAGQDGMPSTIVSRVAESPFADALADLEDAIIGKGLKIDSRNHVADMLERTGKDLGLSPSPYKGGIVVQFCSARLSHQAMRANPDYIAFCPYAVFIYELREKPGRTVIGYRRLPEEAARDEAARKALRAINSLLDDIVREAAEGF